MAVYTQQTTAVTGNTITAAVWNNEFSAIATALNSISNAQIASDAAIVYSKLNLTGAILNADLAGSIAATKITNTAVTLSDTQTISGNKTFSGSNTFSGVTTFAGAVKQTLTSDSDGATVTFDMNVTNLHTVTLGGNRTLALSNTSAGQVFLIRLVQDATGSRTVTWFSTIKWAGGSAPTLTTTANKADTFGFICTSSGNYDGYIVGQNI